MLSCQYIVVPRDSVFRGVKKQCSKEVFKCSLFLKWSQQTREICLRQIFFDRPRSPLGKNREVVMFGDQSLLTGDGGSNYCFFFMSLSVFFLSPRPYPPFVCGNGLLAQCPSLLISHSG